MNLSGSIETIYWLKVERDKNFAHSPMCSHFLDTSTQSGFVARGFVSVNYSVSSHFVDYRYR